MLWSISGNFQNDYIVLRLRLAGASFINIRNSETYWLFSIYLRKPVCSQGHQISNWNSAEFYLPTSNRSKSAKGLELIESSKCYEEIFRSKIPLGILDSLSRNTFSLEMYRLGKPNTTLHSHSYRNPGTIFFNHLVLMSYSSNCTITERCSLQIHFQFNSP